jgi:hypothetical protein
MAVLPTIAGLEVQIYVDGQPLEEYSSETYGDLDFTPANYCSKYVESATNKEFAIRMSTNQNYNWDSPALKFRTWTGPQ